MSFRKKEGDKLSTLESCLFFHLGREILSSILLLYLLSCNMPIFSQSFAKSNEFGPIKKFFPGDRFGDPCSQVSWDLQPNTCTHQGSAGREEGAEEACSLVSAISVSIPARWSLDG